MKMWSHRFFSTYVLFTTLFITVSATSSDKKCVYSLYVETGWVIKAGTDSTISIRLGDAEGQSVWIPNLKGWGAMGRKHDYLERGNLDIFTGRSQCVGPICRINVTSDGSGAHHGWFCDFVQVTSTGPHMGCTQSIFYVDQWLASDAPPYKLSAVLDGCDFLPQPQSWPLVVRKPVPSSTH